MTPLEQLQSYLRHLQARLRLLAGARGAAVVFVSALALTLLLTWIANRVQFAEHLLPGLRILLFLAVALTISFLIVLPLLRLTKRRVTLVAERQVPGLEERLITVAERPDKDNPFTELLAEDALSIVKDHQPREFAPTAWVSALAVCGVLGGAVLLWLIVAGPGYWGYGASLLWTGKARAAARPLYEIVVRPGNKTIRRKSDQAISAQLSNFSAQGVTLHAKYHGALKWEQTPMQPEQNGNGYKFLFAGLSDSVEYYVEAGAMRSQHYTIGVKDLPVVKRVRVALHFPAALGLKDSVQDPGGDVRTVQGSSADISVLTDRPLERGALVLDDGQKIGLARGEGNWLTAKLPVQKDGAYHVASLDAGEAVRISDDYFIEAKPDEAPSVKIVRPGRDPHVSPIEEVPVSVEAADDFGLRGVDLHYSVNGNPEQVVPLSKAKDAKEQAGKTTLYFENFKLVPGDLVSMYATARDATKTSRSDIVFAQAEPFDYQFRQSQQSGGGGMSGGGDDNGQISERQKDIIAATWNELKLGSKARNATAEEASFLSQLQGKLGEQARTMADRMGRRELVDASPEFQGFSKAMTQASEEMNNAVGELKGAKWQNALAPEQRALQGLLRAEAMFRNIQVAFGQRGSQGAGSSGSQRDLERMLDLELDKNKNQYETGDSAASASGQQKAMDEALQRLKLLAQRQQELAAQKQQEQAFEQRWQEEQLRREAEQLRQQLQQLAQNSSGQQSSSSAQQQSAQGSSSSGAQSARSRTGRSGSQSGSQGQSSPEEISQAMKALQRAEDEMRKAVSQHDASAQQRAAQQLAEAESLMRNRQQQQAGGGLSEMAQQAQQIANRQREIARQLQQMYGAPAELGQPPGQPGSGEGYGTANGSMPAMRDPNRPMGRWYFRQLEAQPRRPASAQEKSVATDKEKLGNELEQLQRQMQQQAQSLQAEQPGVSSQVRKALSGAEQDELAMRMKKTAEWMRDGFGSRNYALEGSLTRGTDQLSRDLHAAQQALASAQGDGKGGRSEKEIQALAEVRKLRQQLDNQTRGGQQRQGGSGGDATPYSAIGETMSALSGLRQQLGPRDRGLSRELDGALGGLRHLNDSRSGELDGRLNREILPSLERLEMALNRRLSEDTQAPRTGSPELAPESYRDAVAEYFRKLSR